MRSKQQQALTELLESFGHLTQEQKLEEITERLGKIINVSIQVADKAGVECDALMSRKDIKNGPFVTILAYVCVLEDILGRYFSQVS